VRAFFQQRGIENPALLVDAGHYFVYKPSSQSLQPALPGAWRDDRALPGFGSLAIPDRAPSPEGSFPGTLRSSAQPMEPDRTGARMLSGVSAPRPPAHAPQLDLDVRRLCAAMSQFYEMGLANRHSKGYADKAER